MNQKWIMYRTDYLNQSVEKKSFSIHFYLRRHSFSFLLLYLEVNKNHFTF